MHLRPLIEQLPPGYCEVRLGRRRYSVTRRDFNQGKSLKVYAEELGETDFISFNYYITSREELLKPCEMPIQKVLHFLQEMQLINSAKEEL